MTCFLQKFVIIRVHSWLKHKGAELLRLFLSNGKSLLKMMEFPPFSCFSIFPLLHSLNCYLMANLCPDQSFTGKS